ncbi:hypothetical protein ACROYT_G015174 [Oculina patagonica]
MSGRAGRRIQTQVEAWFNTLHDYNTKMCSTKVKEELQRMETLSIISKLTYQPICVQILARNARSTLLLDDDIHHTLWQILFQSMPFGIKSAPEHYQKKMSQILKGSEGHISIIDDMLIHAKTQEEHDRRLKAVLKKLHSTGTT